MRASGGVDRGQDPARATSGTGCVETPQQIWRHRRRDSLPGVRPAVQPDEILERVLVHDAERGLRLPESTSNMLPELGPNAVEVREILDPVAVADRCLEARPVERQPVRERRREVHVEVVEGRQHRDQLVKPLLLELVPVRPGSADRGKPGSERLREGWLDDRRETVSPPLDVRQARDDIVTLAHDGRGPLARCHRIEPPRLLEHGVDPRNRALGRLLGRQWFERERRMLRHVFSLPSRRSCISHQTVAGWPRRSFTP